MSVPVIPNLLVNGTTTDVGPINQNYTALLDAITDGTKDLTIATLNGTTPLSSFPATTTPVFVSTGGILSTSWGLTAITDLATPKTDINTTGASNDVSTSGRSLLRYTGASTASFTGFANGADGKIVHIINTSAAQLILSHQNTGSVAANRLIVRGASDFIISPNAAAVIQYDSGSSRWFLVASSTISNLEYLHGTTYNGGIAPTVTSSVGGFAVNKASFYPYQDALGVWYMNMHVDASYTANSHSLANISINGITFANEGANGWPLAFAQGNSSSNTCVYCLAAINAAFVQYQLSGAQSGLTFAFNGWAKLASKPTWAY